ILSNAPAAVPAAPAFADADIMERMHSDLAAHYNALRSTLDAAIATFDGSSLRRFEVADTELESRLEAARERFKHARDRAQAYESAIKQVEGLSRRLSEVDHRLSLLERDVRVADEEAVAFNAAASTWVDLVRAKGSITLDRC